MPSHGQPLLSLVRLDAPPVTVGGARSPRDMAVLAAQLPAAAGRPDGWLVACDGVDVTLIARLRELPEVTDITSLRREAQRRSLQGLLLADARVVIVLVRTTGPSAANLAGALSVLFDELQGLCHRVNSQLRDLVWVRDGVVMSYRVGRVAQPHASVGGVWQAGVVTADDPSVASYARLLT